MIKIKNQISEHKKKAVLKKKPALKIGEEFMSES